MSAEMIVNLILFFALVGAAGTVGTVLVAADMLAEKFPLRLRAPWYLAEIGPGDFQVALPAGQALDAVPLEQAVEDSHERPTLLKIQRGIYNIEAAWALPPGCERLPYRWNGDRWICTDPSLEREL